MFTIEHEFDETVIKIVDEGAQPLQGDLSIRIEDRIVTIEQINPVNDKVSSIRLSMHQVDDLRAALDLPEGIYRRVRLNQKK
jgi:hypothetical protein